ncbi:MAG: vWA domain-containing protein [Candidatus Poseidoniales archaeon]
MEENEKPNFKVVKPTDSDEEAKAQGLDDWTRDRMALLNWRPFIGTLAMNLELIPVVDHRCATAATDGKRVFFNPHFLNSLTQEERLTILAHEIWHCGLSHFSREDGRIEDHEMWNHAIDHEVNSLLEDDGFTLPTHAVLYRQYKGESAEVVFDKIKSGDIEMRGEVIDDHNINNPSKSAEEAKNSGTDGWSTIESDGEGGLKAKVDSDYTPQRSDDVWKDWKNKMMAAAQQCQDRGVDMGAYSGRLEDLFDSKIHWRELLRQYLTPLFGSTRKWLPPNRRYVYKRMYLPSIRKEKQLKIVIAVDTSGSTTGDIVKTFVSEVFSILNTFGGYELRLIQCDMVINSDETFDIDRPFIPEEFVLRGGGGTDFSPVFQLVKEDQDPPELLLYLTDGYGSAPSKPPEYPVIWGVIEGGRMPCDWGKEVGIDLGR